MHSIFEYEKLIIFSHDLFQNELKQDVEKSVMRNFCKQIYNILDYILAIELCMVVLQRQLRISEPYLVSLDVKFFIKPSYLHIPNFIIKFKI
jgi:hypothetical protein